MMRRLLFLTLTLFMTVTAYGQDVALTQNDTLKSVEVNNLRQISFKDGDVVTTYSDGSTKSQKLTGSDRLQLTASDREQEGITSDEGTYTIYDLSGRPVKTHKDKSFDQPFDIKDLPSGIYLLKTGNRTIKIVK